jgi:hypothetical protein
MSADLFAKRVQNLYKAVILRAYMDATQKPNQKCQTKNDRSVARVWLTQVSENYILVHDLSGIDWRKSHETAMRLKRDGWPVARYQNKRIKGIV